MASLYRVHCVFATNGIINLHKYNIGYLMPAYVPGYANSKLRTENIIPSEPDAPKLLMLCVYETNSNLCRVIAVWCRPNLPNTHTDRTKQKPLKILDYNILVEMIILRRRSNYNFPAHFDREKRRKQNGWDTRMDKDAGCMASVWLLPIGYCCLGLAAYKITKLPSFFNFGCENH